MTLEDKLQSIKSKVRSTVAIPLIALAAAYAPMKTDAALTIQYGDAAQGPVNTTFIISLINNDIGTIYQSATLNVDALLGGVADYISNNSTDPNFAGQSHNSIYSQMFFTPGGEVSTGWGAVMSGGTLNLTHINGIPGLQYTTWQASSYNNGIQDTMNIYGTIANSALNGLNISSTGLEVDNVFAATTTGGATAYATAYSFQTVPEPSTIGLLGIGLLAIGARRLLKKD